MTQTTNNYDITDDYGNRKTRGGDIHDRAIINAAMSIMGLCAFNSKVTDAYEILGYEVDAINKRLSQ